MSAVRQLESYLLCVDVSLRFVFALRSSFAGPKPDENSKTLKYSNTKTKTVATVTQRLKYDEREMEMEKENTKSPNVTYDYYVCQ